MFDSLRKKFGGWFGKKEEEKPKEEKVSKKEVSKKKVKSKEEKPVEVKKIPRESLVLASHEASEVKEEVPEVEEEIEEKVAEKEEVVTEKAEEVPEKVEEKKEEKPAEPEKKKGFFGKLKDKVFEKKPEPEETTEEVIETIKEKVVGKEELPEKKEEETPKEELKEELVEEETGFFGRLKKKLSTSVLTQEQFDEIFQELEMILLENNVALEVVDKIHESLSKDLVGISVKKNEVEKTIQESLKDSILEVLIEPPDLFKAIEKSLEPYVILFFGINGSGKTTSIAKLASILKEKGFSCVLAAGDTFRAASIEQLEKHANNIGVPIVKGEYGKDPSAVAFDAISYAKAHKLKAVLIDTAGRMYTKSNLMKEMEKIVRVSKPNLKIFVGESITGNDATEQARMFHETAGIDGIILTKADVDEKAGAILSVSHVTGKPIYFLGVGQEYKDLKEFKKKDVLQGLGVE
jgi:fused signal recognition particle receptor